MEIKAGYLYHIKDEFFDVVNDEILIWNHEKGKKIPTYFISINSKVEKISKSNC